MNFFPTTLEEAQLYGEGTYLGGATDLLPLLKNQVRDDRDLIFLSKIPELKEISPEGGHLKIGSAVTLSELAESTDIQTYFPALAQAVQAAASPQIRNIATIGGNIMQDRRCIYFNQSAHWRRALPMCFKTGGDICHQIPNSPVCRAIYYSDAATALLLYDAEVEYLQSGQKFQKPLRELLHQHVEANGKSYRERLRVLITCFLLPYPGKRERSGFNKYAMRASIDFPLINFALRCGGERPSKIVAGAIAPEPAELWKTAALLQTAAPDTEILSVCRTELAELAKPIKEACLSPKRKRDLYAQISPLLYLRRG